LRFSKVGIIQRLELPAIITANSLVVDISTVDYLGHYKGYPVAFDAKESKSKKINIKSNFKPHQIQFLKYFKDSCVEQKECFSGFLILFYEYDVENVYLLDIDILTEAMTNGKKSIDMDDIKIRLPFNNKMYYEYYKI